jgi:hypothetical protein
MDTKTPLHHWNNKQLIFDSDGNKLPDELTERLSTILWEIIEEAFNFSKAAHEKNGGKDIASTDSLQDFIRRRAQDIVSDAKERALLVQMSEMFGAYVGQPVWQQSLRFAWMEECCGGGSAPILISSAYHADIGHLTYRGDVCFVQLFLHPRPRREARADQRNYLSKHAGSGHHLSPSRLSDLASAGNCHH